MYTYLVMVWWSLTEMKYLHLVDKIVIAHKRMLIEIKLQGQKLIRLLINLIKFFVFKGKVYILWHKHVFFFPYLGDYYPVIEKEFRAPWQEFYMMQVVWSRSDRDENQSRFFLHFKPWDKSFMEIFFHYYCSPT